MRDDYSLDASTFIGFTAAQSADWLAENAGTALTVGGSIVVAIIAAVGALWAKHHTPRQPVPIQDVWSENRSLRADLLGAEDRFETLDAKHRKALDALAALWRYVERVRAAWGVRTHMPSLTPAERRTLASLIADADTQTTDIPVVTD